MSEFPRLLYKKSTHSDAQPVWDLGTFEVRHAEDQAAVDAALSAGWTLRPDDEPQAAKPKRAQPQPSSPQD